MSFLNFMAEARADYEARVKLLTLAEDDPAYILLADFQRALEAVHPGAQPTPPTLEMVDQRTVRLSWGGAPVFQVRRLLVEGQYHYWEGKSLPATLGNPLSWGEIEARMAAFYKDKLSHLPSVTQGTEGA